MLKTWGRLTGLAVCATLMGCASAPQSNGPVVVDEVSARTISFPNYPQAGRTYLSFSSAHGFQVNYLAAGGDAYLWYPGNRNVVPENYKRDVIAGQQALCWRHPRQSYNPVTKQTGGKYACMPLDLSRKTIVAELVGDPYKLASGNLPHPLKRCVAPAAFRFDRARFGC